MHRAGAVRCGDLQRSRDLEMIRETFGVQPGDWHYVQSMRRQRLRSVPAACLHGPGREPRRHLLDHCDFDGRVSEQPHNLLGGRTGRRGEHGRVSRRSRIRSVRLVDPLPLLEVRFAEHCACDRGDESVAGKSSASRSVVSGRLSSPLFLAAPSSRASPTVR